MAERTLGIVVPVYNGASLLRQYLGTVLDAGRRAGVSQIVLVDDCSEDNSHKVAAEIAPDALLIRNSVNLGFGETVNRGARELLTTHIAVLMTDLEMEIDSLTNAMHQFTDDSVFAVGLHLKNSDDGGNAGITSLPFSRGMFHTAFPDTETPGSYPDDIYNIAFAVGGAMIADLQKFQQLGGFDKIYSPYYWEDVDLCRKAWSRGWRSINCRSALAWHRHPHTSVKSSADESRIRQILLRNRISFARRFTEQSAYYRQHKMWLMMTNLKALCKGDKTLSRATRESLKINASLMDKGRIRPERLIPYLSEPRREGELP